MLVRMTRNTSRGPHMTLQTMDERLIRRVLHGIKPQGQTRKDRQRSYNHDGK
jgi:hypothetical protein